MKIFDTATTRAALRFDRLVPALATMFAEGCEVPTRHVHSPAEGLIMPAWQVGRYFGLKTVMIGADLTRRVGARRCTGHARATLPR